MAEVFFADTSALSKRYVAERGTAWLTSLVDPSTGNSVYIVRVTAVEIFSALTRRERGGALSATDAAVARDTFLIHLASEYKEIEVTERLAHRAMSLAVKYGLRGYDAVQLAGALWVSESYHQAGRPAITLLSSDAELNAAATAESVAFDDPNTHAP